MKPIRPLVLLAAAAATLFIGPSLHADFRDDFDTDTSADYDFFARFSGMANLFSFDYLTSSGELRYLQNKRDTVTAFTALLAKESVYTLNGAERFEARMRFANAFTGTVANAYVYLLLGATADGGGRQNGGYGYAIWFVGTSQYIAALLMERVNAGILDPGAARSNDVIVNGSFLYGTWDILVRVDRGGTVGTFVYFLTAPNGQKWSGVVNRNVAAGFIGDRVGVSLQVDTPGSSSAFDVRFDYIDYKILPDPEIEIVEVGEDHIKVRWPFPANGWVPHYSTTLENGSFETIPEDWETSSDLNFTYLDVPLGSARKFVQLLKASD